MCFLKATCNILSHWNHTTIQRGNINPISQMGNCTIDRSLNLLGHPLKWQSCALPQIACCAITLFISVCPAECSNSLWELPLILPISTDLIREGKGIDEKEIGYCKAVLNYMCPWNLTSISDILQRYISWKNSIGYSRVINVFAPTFRTPPHTHVFTHFENNCSFWLRTWTMATTKSVEGVMGLIGLGRFFESSSVINWSRISE